MRCSEKSSVEFLQSSRTIMVKFAVFVLLAACAAVTINGHSVPDLTDPAVLALLASQYGSAP